MTGYFLWGERWSKENVKHVLKSIEEAVFPRWKMKHLVILPTSMGEAKNIVLLFVSLSFQVTTCWWGGQSRRNWWTRQLRENISRNAVFFSFLFFLSFFFFLFFPPLLPEFCVSRHILGHLSSSMPSVFLYFLRSQQVLGLLSCTLWQVHFTVWFLTCCKVVACSHHLPWYT